MRAGRSKQVWLIRPLQFPMRSLATSVSFRAKHGSPGISALDQIATSENRSGTDLPCRYGRHISRSVSLSDSDGEKRSTKNVARTKRNAADVRRRHAKKKEFIMLTSRYNGLTGGISSFYRRFLSEIAQRDVAIRETTLRTSTRIFVLFSPKFARRRSTPRFSLGRTHSRTEDLSANRRANTSWTPIYDIQLQLKKILQTFLNGMSSRHYRIRSDRVCWVFAVLRFTSCIYEIS